MVNMKLALHALLRLAAVWLWRECFVHGGGASDVGFTTSHPCMTSHVPVFAANNPHDNLCCREGDNEVITSSWTCELTSILYDVTQRVEWSTAVFVYDHQNSHYQRAIMETLSSLFVGVVHVPVEVTEEGSAEGGGDGEVVVNLTQLVLTTSPFLQSATPSMLRNLILCVRPRVVAAVLEQALSLGLLSADYQWLILCPGQYVLTHHLLKNFTQDSNILMLFRSPPHGQENVAGCCHTPLRGDFFGVSSSGNGTLAKGLLPCNDTHFNLMSYSSYPGPHFRDLASWRIGRGWDTPLPPRLFPNVFQDFDNRLLIIGTIEATPFVNRRQVGNETVYDGFCIDILRTLAAQLNFRYKIVESPDKKFGAPEPDGSWNGMVGMVQREEVDMGVGPYTITSARETVVDFSLPYMEDGGGILTRKSGSTTSYMEGLETFTPAIWISLLGTTIAMGIGLYVVVHFSRKDRARRQSLDAQSDQWHLWNCVMYIVGSLMQQGMETHPKNSSGRCLLGFWWVFSMLIVAIYTATRTSMLTVELQGFRVDSLDDLVISNFKPLVLSGSLWDTTFQTSTQGVYREVADLMKDMPEVTSEKVALDLVMAGETAFLHDINSLQYMYAVNCKELHLASTIFNSNGFGIIMRENAPYKDAVNDLILRLQEGGFLEKWRSVWWPVTSECERSASSVSKAQQLGLTKLTGLLLVYGIVIAASILSFLVSICLYRTGLARRVGRGLRLLVVPDRIGGLNLQQQQPGGGGVGAAAT